MPNEDKINAAHAVLSPVFELILQSVYTQGEKRAYASGMKTGIIWTVALMAWVPCLFAQQIIVPQTRAFVAGVDVVEVCEVAAEVRIREQVATVTLDVVLTNRTNRRLESRMVLPVPEGAVFRTFMFQGAGSEATAELLERSEARRAYDAIVASVRDPALLEFLGCNLIQSSVFPVEPRSGQKTRMVYEQLLPREGDRVDFVLPRTESIEYRVPWRIAARLESKDPIGAVYSPSHELATSRQGRIATARVTSDTTDPGSFRLSFLTRRNEACATLLAYPDAKVGGGYFMLLAGAPVRSPLEQAIEREVILVLDRSGSMAGEKLEQARAAALQVLEGLEDGERFNVIVYNESVEAFAPVPVVKNPETMRAARKYLREMRAQGGTNIHDALQEALRMKASKKHLPLVLFLTDGLPTVGQTSEKTIHQLVVKGNPCQRRVFAFGVGFDVNTPLLDKLALETRGTATFVLSQEDVEAKVARVFKNLSGPVLAAPTLEARNADGSVAYGRVRDLMPARLPDLFEEDQLVVFGRYAGSEPIDFILRGEAGTKEKAYRFQFNLDKSTTRNAFVPRLWASRKIAVLTDAIRELGADGGTGANDPARNPRVRELVDEVVRLSRSFGILSEYTAFLAREGTDLAQERAIFQQALDLFDSRALKQRSGVDSVSQSLNNEFKRTQIFDNRRNKFYDEKLNAVEISTVQQISDRAFFKRGNLWVESELEDEMNTPPARIVRFGSQEFRRLAERLAAENRQGAITLQGEILLRVGGETVLVR